jgi:glycosyltransferase involved in cell wall biosynthesis
VQRAIAHIVKRYAPSVGGMEQVAKLYAEASKASFRKVFVLCIDDPNERSKRVSVERQEGVIVLRHPRSFTVFGQDVALSMLSTLWRVKRSNHHLTIHGHDPFPFGLILMLLLGWGTKRLVTFHAHISRHHLFKALFWLPRRLLLISADRVTATSPALRARLSQHFRVPSQKISVLPIWLPNEGRSEIQGATTPIEFGALERPFALMLGRICHYKGADVLSDALTRLRRMGKQHHSIVIAGECTDHAGRAAIESIKRQSLSNVFVINRRLSEHEKYWLLNRCAYLLFPSTCTEEAFGIVQLEAMRARKPVLNTMLDSGVPWVSLNEVTGWTIPANDASSLADHLATPITKLLSEDLGYRGRQRYLDHFSEAEGLKTMNALYSWESTGSNPIKAINDLMKGRSA